ncbi:MAG: tRNA (adenosine(37)-N6)-dimethylallyltransferase MiaA [Candidatus Omnitrophica bacterium]|nr:tRNA (adenosine(37)-N6)-dimethylallyltransferase MiaA [Candidatus Omnitrophota bacterium]
MLKEIKNKIVFILGPTAVGKSRIAFELAKRIKSEIISADSMQVYRQVPILTSYPPPIMLKNIPHHLISILGLSKEYNVAKFIKDAKSAINKISRAKKIPLVVGGSGLYIQGLLDGIFSGPGEDRALRRRLEKQAERFGNNHVYEKLRQLDPETADSIHPNNLRRIIRALEVCIKSGKKMSEVKKKKIGIFNDYDVLLVGLKRERSQLYQRIDNRVEAMFRQGAVSEAERALKHRLSKTALGIIGIKEIARFLAKEYNRDEAKRLIKRNSRHFAKRQMSWFKRDKRIKWIMIKEGDADKDIVQKILSYI